MNNEKRPGENPEVDNVSGYRKLTDQELELINLIKSQGPDLATLFKSAEAIIRNRVTPEDPLRGNTDLRCLALAQTNIQQGYMWLIRAVSSPKGLV